MKGKPWTPEQDTTLKQLRARGIAYSVIAELMGITKNAAIGRAHRIGLCEPSILKYVSKVSLIPDLSGCNYPHGHPGTDTFHYCNEELKQGSSYCETHHAICWVPIKKKEKDEESRPFKFYDVARTYFV